MYSYMCSAQYTLYEKQGSNPHKLTRIMRNVILNDALLLVDVPLLFPGYL